jgi:predicted ATP-dependent protease
MYKQLNELIKYAEQGTENKQELTKMYVHLTRLIDNANILADDVLERSDDDILLDTANDIKKLIKKSNN